MVGLILWCKTRERAQFGAQNADAKEIKGYVIVERGNACPMERWKMKTIIKERLEEVILWLDGKGENLTRQELVELRNRLNIIIEDVGEREKILEQALSGEGKEES